MKKVIPLLLPLALIGCDTNKDQRTPAEFRADMVAKYDSMRATGARKVELCNQATLVAKAYFREEDRTNGRLWERIERNDCVAAGIPASVYPIED